MSAPSPMCRVATSFLVLTALAVASAFGLRESNANPPANTSGASDAPSRARELPARSTRPHTTRSRTARSHTSQYRSAARPIRRTSQPTALYGAAHSRTSQSRAVRAARRPITSEEARYESRLRIRREFAREHSTTHLYRSSADLRSEPARSYQARRRYRTSRERRREQALRRPRSPSSAFTPARVAVDFHPRTEFSATLPTEPTPTPVRTPTRTPTRTDDRAAAPLAAESGSFAVRHTPLYATDRPNSGAAPTPVAAEAESSPDDPLGSREGSDSALSSMAAPESAAADLGAVAGDPMESDAVMDAATRAAAEEFSPSSAGGAMPPPLRGSLASLQRQDARLEAEGLERIEDDADLTTRISHGMLVPLPVSAELTINPEMLPLHRYCRPWTAQFLSDLARAHAAVFARPLDVSSAVRTVAYQRHLMRVNGNAAPAEGDLFSPHLMGATVDIGKKGMSWREIAWMRRWLLNLEASGKLDVEEEFDQSCFHITVYKTYAPHSPGRVDEPLTAGGPSSPTN
jgi:hypothetical protein